MQDFLAALALVFVLEGTLYTLFPDGMKRMMEQTITLPSSWLRGQKILHVASRMLLLMWLVRS